MDLFNSIILLGSTAPIREHGREGLRSQNWQAVLHRHRKFTEFMASSVFGLVDIYKLLPAKVVSATSISSFQKRLQEMLVIAMIAEIRNWGLLISPRVTLHNRVLSK